MSLPVVAIVGRPNVGKSTLFNRIVGQRVAIVEDKPGVTRDRLYGQAEWLDRTFYIIDTGGIELDSKTGILLSVREQAELAIEEADVILFVVDGESGITPSDEDIAYMLLKTQKPVIVVVNKLDNVKREMALYDFYQLGFDHIIGVSSTHGRGFGDLLDLICAHFPEKTEVMYDDDVIRIAVIGRPNVGKSSLINAILGEERVIVSDIAGTTRDAIDTPFESDGQKYVLIDTAGMRKRGKVYEKTEKYSVIRALKAIDRSDVALIVIDGKEGIIEQDKRVAGYAKDAGVGAIIVINKWDIVEKDDKTMHRMDEQIRDHFQFINYAPTIYVSAKTGRRVLNILTLVKQVAENQAMRIPTSVLNDVLQEALAITPPPTSKGRQLRINYITQVSVKPPTFALFVNDRSLMHFSYERFITNQLREAFGFIGSPIRLFIRDKSHRSGRGK